METLDCVLNKLSKEELIAVIKRMEYISENYINPKAAILLKTILEQCRSSISTTDHERLAKEIENKTLTMDSKIH